MRTAFTFRTSLLGEGVAADRVGDLGTSPTVTRELQDLASARSRELVETYGAAKSEMTLDEWNAADVEPQIRSQALPK